MSDKFDEIMKLAKRLYNAGFAFVPAEGKRPLVKIREWRERWRLGDVTWDEIETELIRWINRKDLNLMVLCGINGIYAIDFDSREAYQDFVEALPPGLREKTLKTLTTETRRGYHVYLKCSEDDLRPQKLRNNEVEWKGYGQQVNAPYSIYEDGSESRPVRGWSENEIYIEGFSREEIEIIWDILGLSRELQITELEFIENIDLSDEQINDIISIIGNYYREGFRDLIVFGLAGLLTKLKVKFEAAERLIQKLTEEREDEEAKQRFYVVRYIYQRARQGKVVPGLRTFAEVLKEAGAEDGEKIAWRIKYIVLPEEMEIPITLDKLRENMWRLKGRRVKIRNVLIRKEGTFNRIEVVAWVCRNCGYEMQTSGDEKPGKCSECKSKDWEIDERKTKLRPIHILRLISKNAEEIAYLDASNFNLNDLDLSQEYDVTVRIKLSRKKSKIIPQLWVEDITESEREVEDDENIWRPNNLDELIKKYKMIVGEERTKKLFALARAAYQLANNDYRIYGIVAQGPSSIGKSHFLNHMLKPDEVDGNMEYFTRITSAAPERMTDFSLDGKILYIAETIGISQSVNYLKLMIDPEAKGLRLLTVDRETGELKEYYVPGKPFLVSATTEISFRNEEFYNRIFAINLDESEEQTIRIKEYQAALAKMLPNPNKNNHVDIEDVCKYWRMIRSKQYYVIVPYADLLVQATSNDIQMRRNFKKILALIMGSAILLQHKRHKAMINGNEIIIADVEDLQNVLDLQDLLRATTASLTKYEMRILDEIPCEGEGEGMTSAKLTERLPLSRNWIQKCLKKLFEAGYLIRRKEGNEYRYWKTGNGMDGLYQIDLEQAKKMVEEYIEDLKRKYGDGAIITPLIHSKIEELSHGKPEKPTSSDGVMMESTQKCVDTQKRVESIPNPPVEVEKIREISNEKTIPEWINGLARDDVDKAILGILREADGQAGYAAVLTGLIDRGLLPKAGSAEVYETMKKDILRRAKRLGLIIDESGGIPVIKLPRKIEIIYDGKAIYTRKLSKHIAERVIEQFGENNEEIMLYHLETDDIDEETIMRLAAKNIIPVLIQLEEVTA
ncbi:hypothetical protein CW705_04535 [Candidatus Bathyarchaeota archaeon]|nr:MAG: hypothetical protein CW705_04535 [Candidatus Bathyarchaeota archaeon]